MYLESMDHRESNTLNFKSIESYYFTKKIILRGGGLRAACPIFTTSTAFEVRIVTDIVIFLVWFGEGKDYLCLTPE